MADGNSNMILSGASMQVNPDGSGCGGMIDMIANALQKIVNPATSSAQGVCDKLFRKSSFAEVLERYSTVFPRWVSSTPAAVGGDLRFTCFGVGSGGTPTNDFGSLEFFRNGVDQNAIASNPVPRQTQNAPAVGNLGVGEGAPFPLSLNETNGMQPMLTGSDNADFVQDQGQDFVVGGIAIEIYMDAFVAVNGASADAAVESNIAAWLTQGSTSYAERLYKTLLTGSNLRISWRDEGQDRFYRIGRPMDWPSYSGLFGSKNALSPGQPVAFQFKELPFGLQTNRRPKVDTNARVKFFLDVPRQIRVSNDPVNQTPANISQLFGPNNNLLGTVFTGLTMKLFGAMVCVDPNTGLITDKPADGYQRAYDAAYASLIQAGQTPQAAAAGAAAAATNVANVIRGQQA